MEVKLILTTIVLLALALCVQGGKKEKDKHGKKGKDMLKMLPTCMGQPLNISQVMPSIEECLDNRVNEVVQDFENSNDNGKKKKNGKNKEKKMAKLAKKLRKKCAMECKWSSFGLIPNTTENGTTYDSSDVDLTDFLELFPREARDSLEEGVMACFNTTTVMPLKNGKDMKNGAKKMCMKNKRLMKCLQKTMRNTCKSVRPDTQLSTPMPQAPGNSNVTNSGTTMFAPAVANASTPATTTTSPAASSTPAVGKSDDDVIEDESDDEEEEDDETEDDDDDDEDEVNSESPTTNVDTSRPITK